jgi:hypothetical protein
MFRRRIDMKDEEIADGCPLQAVVSSSPPAGRGEETGLPFTIRIKRALRRRLSMKAQRTLRSVAGAVLDLFHRRPLPAEAAPAFPASLPKVPLHAGDQVRVRSKEQIEATLDRWRSLKGCAFLEEMAVYCGTTQRVLKRVERFIDERDFRLKKASGIILLEGLMCSGTSTTGRCDRACFFFWREEWLDRVDGPAALGE